MFPQPFILLLPILCLAAATTVQERTIHLIAKPPIRRSLEEWHLWSVRFRQTLQRKYGVKSSPEYEKRFAGTTFLVDQFRDFHYYGSIAIGTPPQPLNVLLDTGSGDTWVVSENCDPTYYYCGNITTRYSSNSSSTFTDLDTPYLLNYHGGVVAGYMSRDVVQMAGFAVTNQIFARIDMLTNYLIYNPLSGSMGLAFRDIGVSGAMPFWENLVTQGVLNEPLMAFQLTRFSNSSYAAEHPGGQFNLGFLNHSLYTGNIEYNTLVDNKFYWLVNMSRIGIQGETIELPLNKSGVAAVDTGIQMIGGPANYIEQIYANIPLTYPIPESVGIGKGLWSFPCDYASNVSVSITFGGREWHINPLDFNAGEMLHGRCVGAFYELDLTGSPNGHMWIIGDTFLKNVYSVFRYSRPAVGFAQLSETALEQNGVSAALPSPTVGISTAISATATYYSVQAQTETATRRCVPPFCISN